MSDLIERLEAMKTENCCNDPHHCHEDDETLNEAIAALSHVLPDDVKKAIDYHRIHGRQDIADLLERQARALYVAKRNDPSLLLLHENLRGKKHE